MKQIEKKYNRQEVLHLSSTHEAKETESKSHALHYIVSKS